jgi:hypothetical protein
VKLILASPSYGPIEPECAHSLRYAMMVATHHGTEWIADAAPNRMTYSTARNMVAQWVFDNPVKVDGVMWVDSDIICGNDSIARLMHGVEKYGSDIMSGVYHQRHPPYDPLFQVFEEKTGHFKQCSVYPENSITTVDGCGFGFVFTSTRSILAIAKHPDFDSVTTRWFPDKRHSPGGFGEDLSFCYYAMKLGIRVQVDTGVQLIHCGDPEKIDRSTQMRYLESQKNFKEVSLA